MTIEKIEGESAENSQGELASVEFNCDCNIKLCYSNNNGQFHLMNRGVEEVAKGALEDVPDWVVDVAKAYPEHETFEDVEEEGTYVQTAISPVVVVPGSPIVRLHKMQKTVEIKKDEDTDELNVIQKGPATRQLCVATAVDEQEGTGQEVTEQEVTFECDEELDEATLEILESIPPEVFGF